MAGFGLTIVVVLATLFCLLTQGYSLKCSVYLCTGSSPDAAKCNRVSESNCPDGNVCAFQSVAVKQKGGNVIYAEEGSCLLKSVCNVDYCKKANVTGMIASCNRTCCEKDICNARGPLPTPTNAPTGGGVMCYTCDSLTVNGVLNKTTCDKPKKVKCSAKEDRCIKVKMTLVNKVGTFIPEYRGCANEKYCNNVCVNANETEGGRFTTCDKKCCFGNLCNTELPNGGNLIFYNSSLWFGIMAFISLWLSC